MKLISSLKNPELRNLRLLYDKARERKKQGLFLIEGERELQKAVMGNYTLKNIFIEAGSLPKNKHIKSLLTQVITFFVKKPAFEKITRRSGSEKILAIVKSKTHYLEDLNLSNNPLILVVEAPEKPGNIGALYRTAVAAKINAIIIANPKTDFYNPNTIRSSLGSVFLMPTAQGSSREVISFLKKNSYTIVTTNLDTNAVNYDSFDYKTPCAIVMGSEKIGLETSWLEVTHQNLIIPMDKRIDSLNLSVSAGILMYEARRKKNLFKKNSIL